MAYVATTWGYDVDGTLPPILTLEDFHELTGSQFVSDERIEACIMATTARFRSWCGWHVVGSLSCRATMDGGERRVWLPTAHLTDGGTVTVCGTDVTDACQWSHMGELRLPYSPDVLGAVVVEFTSGYGSVPEDLAALVAHRVMHTVAMPFGVQQETAGSASISYAASAINGQGSVHLTQSDRTALSAFRLQEVR